MAKLIYSAIASADGYTEDAAGSFGWGAPDDELLRFVNGLQRPVGTYLYGRRMYETMLYWETAHTVPGQPSSVREFTGIWRQPRRSCSQRHSNRCRAPGHGSNGTSIPVWSGN